MAPHQRVWMDGMAERSSVKREQEEFSKKTVLIVDDEAGMRTLLRAVVEGASVPCRIVAADGDSAVEIARRDRPDLVLLDIVLPGSSASGVLVCQELCKDSRTKVVIVSGQAGRSIIDACLNAGAIEHVQKPFSVSETRARMKRWLSQ